MNFEINKEDNKSNFQYKVIVNGKEIGYAHSGNPEYGDFYVFIEKPSKDLFKNSLQEIFNYNVNTISLNIDNNKYGNLDIIDKDSSLVLDRLEGYSLFLTLDIVNWNKGITIINFLKKLDEHLKTDKEFYFKLEENKDFLESGIYVSVSKTFTNENIGELYHSILKGFNQLVEVIFQELNNENTLVSKFNFPSEIQSSCEQYLVYFSSFLADLGINATTEITSSARNTLFTVTPENSEEALGKIKEALDIYLNLPNSKNLDLVSKDFTDLSVQQLVANVYHLKSQLLLAKSTIELKDATIETLKFNNYQIQKSNSEPNNEEKVFGGVASVDQFEWKGFKLNLAEVLRRLKRRF